MKSKNNWKKLNKVILRVDNVELRYKKNLSIILNCGFENISKGRCILNVNTKDKKKKDTLFVFTDKALMSVEVFYGNEEIIDYNGVSEGMSYREGVLKKIWMKRKQS